jgi:2-polyprenyl-3-methyl-5-hydroxy-6-metoxy-1,4-benzoquinol methylase
MPRFVRASYEEVAWERVRRVTVVPFLSGGAVVLASSSADGQWMLPAGPIEPGEDPLVDTVLRVPLATAGFRRQATHVLARSVDGTDVAFWVEGARYTGTRPHARDVPWRTGPADEAAAVLRQQGDPEAADLVARAGAARQGLTDEQYFADSRRLLETAYLAAPTTEGGSGFGGDPDEWREARSVLCDAIDRDGAVLDVGCANGLLMASLAVWCAERGRRVEPYGVDLSPALVDLARRRLPRWADRIWVGNALTWVPPGARRFDVVHTLLDLVPARRHGDLVAHLLDAAVAPGGRLVVSHHGAADPAEQPEAVLTRLGHPVAGTTRPPTRRGRPAGVPSAWTLA